MASRGVVSSWLTGWRLLWRNKRMWLWLWIFHLAGAAVLAGLFSSIWTEVLGTNRAAEEFGGPRTANIVVDLFAHHRDALGGLFPGSGLFGNPFGFLAVLYAWLGVILAAGILAGLRRTAPAVVEADEEDPDAQDLAVEIPVEGSHLMNRGADLRLPFLGRFLRDCGTYAGRFTRLMIVQVVATGITLVTLLAISGRVSDSLLGPYPDPAASTRAALVSFGLVVLAYTALAIIGDYAKVRLISEERASAVLAWVAGLRWALRRLPRVLGLHFVFILLSAAGAALYWYLSSSGGLSETVIAIVLVQQVYLIFRAGLRVHWYGAELALFEGSRRSVG